MNESNKPVIYLATALGLGAILAVASSFLSSNRPVVLEGVLDATENVRYLVETTSDRESNEFIVYQGDRLPSDSYILGVDRFDVNGRGTIDEIAYTKPEVLPENSSLASYNSLESMQREYSRVLED